MPLRDDIQLSDTELLLHFETNQVIGAADLARFLAELADYVRLPSQFGADHKLVLRRLHSGSPLDMVLQVLDSAGDAATLATFGLLLVDRWRGRRETRMGNALADLIVNNGVHELDVLFDNPGDGGRRRLTLHREDIPAVNSAEHRQALREERAEFRPMGKVGDRLIPRLARKPNDAVPPDNLVRPVVQPESTTHVHASGPVFTGRPIGAPELTENERRAIEPQNRLFRLAGVFTQIVEYGRFEFKAVGTGRAIDVECVDFTPPLSTPVLLMARPMASGADAYWEATSFEVLDKT